jgi:hypothetical protein
MGGGGMSLENKGKQEGGEIKILYLKVVSIFNVRYFQNNDKPHNLILNKE